MGKTAKKDVAQSERARNQFRDSSTGRFTRKPQSTSNAAAIAGPSRPARSPQCVSSRTARFPAAPRLVLELRDKIEALENKLHDRVQTAKILHDRLTALEKRYEDLVWLVEENGIKLFNVEQEVKQKKDNVGTK